MHEDLKCMNNLNRYIEIENNSVGLLVHLSAASNTKVSGAIVPHFTHVTDSIIQEEVYKGFNFTLMQIMKQEILI